jgi:hypothetical protein
MNTEQNITGDCRSVHRITMANNSDTEYEPSVVKGERLPFSNVAYLIYVLPTCAKRSTGSVLLLIVPATQPRQAWSCEVKSSELGLTTSTWGLMSRRR